MKVNIEKTRSKAQKVNGIPKAKERKIREKPTHLKKSILKKRVEFLNAILNESGSDDDIIKDIKESEIFQLNNVGEASLITVCAEERCPLIMQDIYSLLISALIKKSSSSPRWFSVSRKCRVVLVIADGIGVGDLKDLSSNENCKISDETSEDHDRKDCFQLRKYRTSPKSNQPMWLLNSLQRSSSCFPVCLEFEKGSSNPEELLRDIIFPDAASAEKLLQSVSEEDSKRRLKNKLLNKAESYWDSVEHKNQSFDRRKLLLSLKTMCILGYPVPSQNSPFSNFIYTKEKYEQVKENSPMFGLDCEMCRTTFSNELSQISIVNEKFQTVYSSYVKPPNKIIDYITEISGVLPKHIRNCEVNLGHVQDFIRKNLPPDAILVGHSFHSDLRALQMMHPYVIDTSMIFNITGVRSSRSSLKLLTQLFLQKGIQSTVHSHDPTEDAISTLKLAMCKLKTDVNFGDAVLRGEIPYTWEELQNFTKANRYEKQKVHEAISSKRFTPLDFMHDKKINSTSLFYMMAKSSKNDFRIVTSKEAMNTCRQFLPLANRKPTNIISAEDCPVKILETLENNSIKFQMAYIPKCDPDGDSKKRMRRLRKMDRALKDLHSRFMIKPITPVIILTLFTGSSIPKDKEGNGCLLLDVIDEYSRKKETAIFKNPDVLELPD